MSRRQVESIVVKIEQILQPLIGEPLSDMWRYAGHQKFEFGIQRPHTNRKGKAVTWADWGLVVNCIWRITGPEGEVVSSDHFGPEGKRRDEAAYPFYHKLKETPPLVEKIEATETGGIRLLMSQGYMLEVLPLVGADWSEWRFMPKDKRRKHFVVTGEGIQK